MPIILSVISFLCSKICSYHNTNNFVCLIFFMFINWLYTGIINIIVNIDIDINENIYINVTNIVIDISKIFIIYL